ncbi:MAG: polysaccharide biosynthesis tyrosine autokinase [Dethiobacter sp.]|jgi:capsular exopolysaccharide synthesis family protein|nr:MAG: polysaccharide biosynthesis tyrosine autokinase [Dethiobacter sp.]
MRKKQTDSYDGKVNLITLTSPKSPIVEAYHSLRTNILFSGLDKPIRSILVTSPLPDGGKTTTVSNLGVTISRTGARVIIVDGDLRRPAIHRVFGLDNKVGLTNLLVEENLTVEDALQETEAENLYILTSGPLPPNPSELLVSAAFSRLLEKIKEQCDFLLIDSSPALAVTDPALLSRYVDGTILVINFGDIPREVAQKAKEQLENVKANIIGVVLNKIPSNGTGYYYYYYYHYYGEHGEKANRKKRRQRRSEDTREQE